MDLYISVKDEKSELFLQILKEFKNNMVETFRVVSSEYVSDEEQKEIEEILSSRTAEDKEIGFSKSIEFEV
jgi:hypothetical protein